MINAYTVKEISQQANLKKWLKNTQDKLNSIILETAKTGKREVELSFKDLIIGSETLYESGEMLMYINTFLKEAGFSHVVKPNGVLIISW